MISRNRNWIVAAVLTIAQGHCVPALAVGTFFKNRTVPAPAAAAPTPVQQPAVAASPAPPTAVTGSVDAVTTTDTLVVAGRPVQLAGVSGVGGDAVAGLRHWLAGNGNQVTCQPAGARYTCVTAKGEDVGQVVVFNGAGKAAADASPAYRAAETQARAARKGLWAQ
jgi:endonuclease YncB( thermonuclease family)